MELLLNCLATINVKLRVRKANFGYFMEQFFAFVMARTPQEVRMAMPDITLNEDLSVQPHPDPLASTLNSQEYAICEVDGAIDAQTAEILPVTSSFRNCNLFTIT